MPKHEERFYTVRGAWPFPIDMLRYDCCYPATETESGKLTDLLERKTDAGVIELRLATRSERGPTHGRWDSHTWQVIASHRSAYDRWP